MKPILILSAICVITTTLFSQTLKLDSLWQVYNRSSADTIKIMALLQIGDQYEKQADSAIYFYKKALEKSKEIANNMLSAKCNRYLAFIYGNVLFNLDSCENSYYNAIEYYRMGNDIENSAACYLKFADVCFLRKSYKKAIENYSEALKLFINLNDKKNIAKCYNNMSLTHLYNVDYENAKICLYDAIKMYKEINNAEGIENCYSNLVIAHYGLFEYEKAIEYSEMAFHLFQAENNKKGLAACYANTAKIFMKKSDYNSACEYLQKALALNSETENYDWMRIDLLLLMNVQLELGDYNNAIENAHKALKICEKLNKPKEIASLYSEIASVYHMMGDKEAGLDYQKKSLELYEKENNKWGMAQCYHNIGTYYSGEEARKYYMAALKLNEEIGNKAYMFKNYDMLGLTCNNDLQKKREYAYKALKTAEEIPGLEKNEFVPIYINISVYHKFAADSIIKTESINKKDIYKNHLDTALQFLNKALDISESVGALSEMQFALSGLAQIYMHLDDFVKAEKYLSDLILLNNKNINNNFCFFSEKEKESFIRTISYFYIDYYTLALKQKEEKPLIVCNLYNDIIKTKGQLLKSSTAMRNAILNSGDTAIIEKYEDWIAIKRQISQLYSQENIPGKTKLDSLENNANEMERGLAKSSMAVSDFEKLQSITWQDVQKGLKQNEAAIEFINFKLKGQYFSKYTDTIIYCALIVKPESQYPEMIKLFDEKKLEGLLSEYSGNSYDYVSEIYGKNNGNNNSLYNIIWQPMEESLKNVKTVYISPSGLLHKISFAAICKEQNVYLCDIYDLKMQSSTGKIAMPESSVFSDNINASIFGGINYNSDSTKSQIWSYLEGTKTEAINIQKLFRKKNTEVKWFSDTTASEENFKINACNSSIIHIATHGFFYPDPVTQKQRTKNNTDVEPEVTTTLAFRGGTTGFGTWRFVNNKNPLMRSGLVFAGANDVWSREETTEKDDGVLTAQEVVNIDMRKTDLVVMSACESGLGDIRGSEGVYGLQRAFKMAGVKYIIMSLWQIPDKETVEFMEMFYKKLLKENDVRMAFNETQKEMRNKYDPYYWAAFVLIE